MSIRTVTDERALVRGLYRCYRVLVAEETGLSGLRRANETRG